MNVVLSTPQLAVTEFTPSVDVTVVQGLSGQRGSLIFTGPLVDPNSAPNEQAITGSIDITLNMYDLYISSVTQRGWQYLQTLNGLEWVETFNVTSVNNGFDPGIGMRTGITNVTTDANGYAQLVVNTDVQEAWDIKSAILSVDQSALEIQDPAELLLVRPIGFDTVNTVNILVYRLDAQPFQTSSLNIRWAVVAAIGEV